MHTQRIMPALAVYLTVFFILAPVLIPAVSRAQVTNLAVCNDVFNLLPGTVHMSSPNGNRVMNGQVCTSYQELIPRYQIGSRSAPCIKTKAEGITGLNPEFAVALNKMLKEVPGGSISIVSALRPRECQGSVNPESNHIYGCAVDLGYSQNDCNSQACQWIRANASRFGLQIRMQYAPEWNHIEPINVQACRKNAPNATPAQPARPEGGDASDTPVGLEVPDDPTKVFPSGNTTPLPAVNPTSPTGLSGFPTGVPLNPASNGGNNGGNNVSFANSDQPIPNINSSPLALAAPTNSAPATLANPIPTTASYATPYTPLYTNPSSTSTAVVLSGEAVNPFGQLRILSANQQPNRTTVIQGVTTPQPEILTAEVFDIGNSGVTVSTGGRNAMDGTYEPYGTYAYQQGALLDNPRPDRYAVTETFSGSTGTKTKNAEPAIVVANTPKYDPTVIGTLLVILRDFLALFKEAMVNDRTFGFNGPWKPAIYNEHAGE